MRALLLLVLAVGACSFTPGYLPGMTIDAGDGGVDDAAPDGPNVSAWRRRKPITIAAARVTGGPHLNFPVLIDIDDDAQLATGALQTAADLLFTADDGTTALPYERIAYNPVEGDLLAWVRVPSITSAGNTTIYLYYANPEAQDQQQVAATWSEGYVGAWHLDGNGTDAKTGTTATTMSGTSLSATGHIAGAAQFDGVDDLLVMANSASLDSTAMAGTFSLWIYYEDRTRSTSQFIMASSNNHVAPKLSFEWATGASGNNFFYPCRGDGDVAYNLTDDPFVDDRWQHAAVTLDYATTTVEIFVNGVVQDLTVKNANDMWMDLADPADWYWGGHTMYTAPFLGRMDELRVANVVRSHGWIATEHANQLDAEAFVTVGPEEQL